MKTQRAIRVFVLATAAGLATPLYATENSGTTKPPGVDTVGAGLMHESGWRVTTTLAQYSADENRDGNGDKPRNISNFFFRAQALSVRLQYVWPGLEWLGAAVETRVGGVLYSDLVFRADIQTPGGTLRRRGTDSGPLPGGFVGPVLLGWRGNSVRQVFGPLILFPMRGYDRTQTSNISSGYRSLTPFYGITWFPTDTWEASAAVAYLVNQKNGATGYQSGREWVVDFGADYAALPQTRIGLSGYGYKQVSDDKLNGVPVAGGNRGQVWALGPQIRYRVSKDFGMTFKWHPEFAAENRPVGNRFMLQFFNTF